jgi:hypothetical protein
MNDFVHFFYTEFLLRDYFGYIVPGAIVLMAALYFFAPRLLHEFLNVKEGSWWKTSSSVIAVMSAAYLTGHALQGSFFDAIPNRIFSYAPNLDDSNTIDRRIRFLHAVQALDHDHFSDSVYREERERIVVLKQFTGTASAALLLSAVFCVTASIKDREFVDNWWKLAALLLLGFGLLSEHRQLIHRQKYFEDGVTELATR